MAPGGLGSSVLVWSGRCDQRLLSGFVSPEHDRTTDHFNVLMGIGVLVVVAGLVVFLLQCLSWLKTRLGWSA
jgi:hypothetical protein